MEQLPDVPSRAVPVIESADDYRVETPLAATVHPRNARRPEIAKAVPSSAIPDRVYRGGAHRDDTTLALVIGSILTAVASGWVALTLFELVRDWNR